jgi:hypothetical protein
MATHFVQAGPHTTFAISTAEKYVLLEQNCGMPMAVFLTPKEARELAVRLTAIADAIEPREPTEYDR